MFFNRWKRTESNKGTGAARGAGGHQGRSKGAGMGMGNEKDVTMPEDTALEQLPQMKISPDLTANLSAFRQLLGRDTPDVVIREVKVGEKQFPAAIIYIDGMVDEKTLMGNILEPLMAENVKNSDISNKKAGLKQMATIIECTELKYLDKMDDAINDLLDGSAIIMMDSSDNALGVNIKRLESRSIDEATSEPVVRGPKEGFVEQIRTNTSLVRRRLKTPRLRIEGFTIGALTKTKVELLHIRGLANPQVVAEVRRRLQKIETDSILESGYIEEFIQDAPLSPFNTIMRTERPDKVTAHLLEGRVAILTDNTPFALTMPVSFNSFLQASEDYYIRYYLATFLRALRFGALLVSLLLPSLWVAIISFHPEALPTSLLLTVAAAKEGVPFPAVVEALLLESVFETLREAGLRLPRQIGSAISIIGGVVLGEAAVSAGLLSPPMLVIVAFTGIASFAIPDFSAANTLRLLRFPMLIISGFLGIYGLMMGVIIILLHMTSLRSFGYPFMATGAPLIPDNFKDFIVRAPWWVLDTRAKLIGAKEPVRQEEGMMPHPPRAKEKGAKK